MKKTLFMMVISCFFVSCGHVIDSGVYKQIKFTVSDFTRIYSDKYNDDAWGNDNFGRIYHPQYNRESKIPSKLMDLKIQLDTVEGLKIYETVSRKDIIYVKSDNSYLIRNDYLVIAILKNGQLEICQPKKVISQYCWLKVDMEDNNLYKVIDAYPTIMTQEFIFKGTFIEHYTNFVADERIKNKIMTIK